MFPAFDEVVFIFKLGSPRLQSGGLCWVENRSSRHLLDGGNILAPEGDGKVKMEEVKAKKPDDVVDVEDDLGAQFVSELVVREEEEDIKH